MNINNYIDFEKMFLAICEETKDYIYDFKNDNQDYVDILNFYNDYLKNGKFWLDIDTKECEITTDYILFSFSEEYQTANESNNQNEWVRIDIGYNRSTELFTYYEYEAG